MGAFTNAEQLRLLLQSLLLGVGIGLFYDVLRALRRHFACGRAATAVYDALFWLATAAALFEFGIVFAAGQDRWFVIGGAVLAVLGGLLGLAARGWNTAAAAAQWVRRAAERSGLPDKFRSSAKKIANSSSIFRRKGIK